MGLHVDRQKLAEISKNVGFYVQLSKQIDDLMKRRKLAKDAANSAWEAVYWKAKAEGAIPIDLDVPDLIGSEINVQIDNEGNVSWEEYEEEPAE